MRKPISRRQSSKQKGKEEKYDNNKFTLVVSICEFSGKEIDNIG